MSVSVSRQMSCSPTPDVKQRIVDVLTRLASLFDYQDLISWLKDVSALTIDNQLTSLF